MNKMSKLCLETAGLCTKATVVSGPRLSPQAPTKLGEALGPHPWALQQHTLDLGGVGLQRSWGMAQVEASRDLRVHVQVTNDC